MLIDQVLRRGDAVVEDILLLQPHSGLVPLFAVFAASSKVGDGKHSPLLQPREPRRAEGGIERDVESTVAVEDGRIRAVELEAGLVDQEHRYARAVLAGKEDLLAFERAFLEPGNLRDAKDRRLLRSNVVAKD